MKPARTRSRTRRAFLFLLVAVVLVGTALRIVSIPEVPGGLNQDEASAGYEAWSLLETGKDKWGHPFPAYFVAWGSGQNVLYSYLLAPWIGLFGLSVATIRLPAVLLGVLTLPLFYATLRECSTRGTAFLATLLLAVLPWHVIASRWALESNLLPFFLLAGTYTTLRARRSPHWIPLALVPWALALYAYVLAVPTVALLVAVTLARARRSPRADGMRWLAAVLVFALIALPVLVFLAKNTLRLPTGAVEEVLPCSIPMLASQRWSQVSEPLPARLAMNAAFFASGFEDGLPWNQTEHAPLSVIAPLVVLAGVALALARTRRGTSQPFLLWFLACLPLFAITTLNINRANAIFLPSLALAALALRTGYRRLSGTIPRRLALVSAGAALALVTASFAASYFLRGKPTFDGFYTGLEQACRSARSAAGEGEPVVLSCHIGLPYLFTLVFERVPPKRFQEAREFSIAANGTYGVRRVGNTYFDVHDPALALAESFVGVLTAEEARGLAGAETLAVVGDWLVVRKHAAQAVAR